MNIMQCGAERDFMPVVAYLFFSGLHMSMCDIINI